MMGTMFHESTDMDPLAHDVMMRFCFGLSRAFGKRGLLSFSDTFFDDGNNGDGLWTERVGFSSGRRGLSFHLLQSKSKRSKMWTSRRMMVVDVMSMLASVTIWSLLFEGLQPTFLLQRIFGRPPSSACSPQGLQCPGLV
ncbi:hypothetical protein MPTK1_6g17200 [Marchantia polymorpha subsp. ruderalis]|uniref:Uncharacterized protein n=2 Tax=Marchantia polymorpha TaxID=3197 RepID=A0AAF6BSY4_MARPO|nr:hypothetical protein MARPO_1175s0001 [Marchantia polymorpha]BBN15118.1 hypothetical protein Mp_6g17200 [Marchantia polymorpha subsp. ruderalis]|eukprot:PTQ26524.1 hypothetical protein MARPO_1175s0001 [Marchantia polymorpha]